MKKPKASRFQLCFCLVAYLIAVLMQLPTLIRSGFLTAFLPECVETFAFYAGVILLVYAAGLPFSRLLLTAGASALASGNLSIALLYFVCRQDSNAAEMLEVLHLHQKLHLLTLLGGWFLIAFTDYISKKHYIIETMLASFAALMFSAIILFASGMDSNSSLLSSGRQPAIIGAFIGIVFVVISLSRQPIPCRVVHIVLAGILAGSLIVRRELGIPIFVSLICLLGYLLIYPAPKMSTLLVLVTVVCSGCGMLFAVSNDLRCETLKKLTERSADNEHIQSVLTLLSSAGLFGNPTYTVRVAAIISDFSLARSIHDWGLIWLWIVFGLFLIGGIKAFLEESRPHGFGFSELLPGFCSLACLVFVTYNLCMSLHLVPLIGVQALFCGKSSSFAVLSAMLLSAATFPDLKKLHTRFSGNKCLRKLWEEFTS